MTARRAVFPAIAASAVSVFALTAPVSAGGGGPKTSGSSTKPLDLFEEHKDEYAAGEKPTIVEVAAAKYLTITGVGAPGSETFLTKVSALYRAAVAVSKKHGLSGKPYRISPIEGMWWASDGKSDLVNEPRDSWRWRLVIRTPEFVTEEEVAATAKKMRTDDKKEFEEIRLETIEEGRCVQALHLGPYATEPETIAIMTAYAKEMGLSLHGVHHEIYLNDPSRVAPEDLRTILRHPVR